MVAIDRRLIRFAVAVFVVSLLYFALVSSRYGEGAEQEGVLEEIGEFFGAVGAYALVGIYARSLLKIVLSRPLSTPGLIPQGLSSYGPRLLKFLNTTHYHLGLVAIAVIYLHAFLEGPSRFNAFLSLVLILLAWQGLFGFLILAGSLPTAIRRTSYPAHAQLFTGVMLLIFAGFGHLLGQRLP